MADLAGADFMLAEKDALYRCLRQALCRTTALFPISRHTRAYLFGANFEVFAHRLTTLFRSAPPDDDQTSAAFATA